MAYEYSKRPLWQWILIYIVVGGLIYGLVYYFVFAKKGGYSYKSTAPSTTTQAPPTTNSSANEVTIKSFSFSPAALTIKVGDQVTWINQDSAGHSATADDNSFDTGVLPTGQSSSVTFSKAGNYTYHCSIHPSMKATIIVK